MRKLWRRYFGRFRLWRNCGTHISSSCTRYTREILNQCRLYSTFFIDESINDLYVLGNGNRTHDIPGNGVRLRWWNFRWVSKKKKVRTFEFLKASQMKWTTTRKRVEWERYLLVNQVTNISSGQLFIFNWQVGNMPRKISLNINIGG